MLEELTQRQIKTAVNAQFPALSDWLEDAQEALYRSLWFANCAQFRNLGASPDVAAQLETVDKLPPDVAILADFFGLVTAVYRDAWLECHVSGAAAETAELPPPPGWELAAAGRLPG